MSADEVTWADPPPPGRSPGRPSPRRDAMRANPGRWLLFATYPTNPTTRSAANRLRLDGFETTTRGCDLYARFVEATS